MRGTSETEPRLSQLKREKRSLSDRRRRLQRRIDSVSDGDADPLDLVDQLYKLLREELETTARQRHVQDEIDALRAAHFVSIAGS